MTYAFSFDASTCTGCKACQAACKDKNNLPAGVLWRRVYEAGGGEWTKSGEAWTSTVFAYNLSIACNHCVHPKCAGVCPVKAYTVRDDGIVLLDSSKCIGCGYCSWACPYGAPQYDQTAGVMTKCDLCVDNLDAGLPPACAAACPLRVLDLADPSKLETRGYRSSPVFPMPVNSRTEPRVFIKPHPAAERASKPPQVFNREETAPRRGHSNDWAAREEIPLLVFTLLGQMAAGISWFIAILGLTGGRFPPALNIMVGVLLVVSLLIAFFHLGKPINAWRVFTNLHKSWLSKEILTTMLFLCTWAISYSFLRVFGSSTVNSLIGCLPGIASAAMVFSMAEVYRLRMVPAWNSWKTKVAFFLSAWILGGFGVSVGLFIAERPVKDPPTLFLLIAPVLALLLGTELIITTLEKAQNRPTISRIRMFLLFAAILGIIMAELIPFQMAKPLFLPTGLIVIIQEIIGRWSFYASRNPIM